MKPELLAFIVTAKRNTYAAKGEETPVGAVLPGSKQFECASGDYLYRDVHFGSRAFAGQEVVYEGGVPVWSMIYFGGVLGPLGPAGPGPAAGTADEIYAFLRQALRAADLDHPYRGPASLVEGRYVYLNEASGSPEGFRGRETITRDGAVVYELRYQGGRIE